jgi:hypothetical protein
LQFSSASNLSSDSSAAAYEIKIAQALDVINYQEKNQFNGGGFMPTSSSEAILGKRARPEPCYKNPFDGSKIQAQMFSQKISPNQIHSSFSSIGGMPLTSNTAFGHPVWPM